MTVQVNMLLQWPEEAGPVRVERVLYLDPTGKVITIALGERRALPVVRNTDDLETDLRNGRARLLDQDPSARLCRPEQAIPEKHRARRDQAWQLIRSLVEDRIPELFDPVHRGPLIEACVRMTGINKKTVYAYLRRYWQGGQTINTLIPNYDRCGGKGKLRTPGTHKRGRPSAVAKARSESRGVNVDEEIRRRFHTGITMFYETKQARSLCEAYQLTINRFFNVGYELVGNMLVPQLPPAEERPSLAQFIYWYEKERSVTKARIARAGSRAFELRGRAVLGDTSHLAPGPGSVYQIDATIGDVYLVSSLDRTRIIGRPVITVVIDMYSRMITGCNVSLEGPSWMTAMQAMTHALTDKVAWCQQYGISITTADWPSQGLPEAFLADRGELEGYSADTLVRALGIRVANCPPFRADWKGIVERCFRLANDKFIHWMPGAVYRPRERGERDYRLDAVLDLHQFTKLLLLTMLDHNHHHRLKGYRLDRAMIQDHVAPYPLELWNWGIRNRTGHLRTLPADTIRFALLPEDQATVTHQGLRFRSLHYSCPTAFEGQWFEQARERGSWRVPVAFDPRRADEIYLRLDGGTRHEICRLLRDARFEGCSWWEVSDYAAREHQAEEVARTPQQQAAAAYQAQVDKVVAEATEQTHAATGRGSNRARIKSIRDNRRRERDLERARATEQVPGSMGEPAPVLLLPGIDHPESEYVPPAQPHDLIRQFQEETYTHESGPADSTETGQPRTE